MKWQNSFEEQPVEAADTDSSDGDSDHSQFLDSHLKELLEPGRKGDTKSKVQKWQEALSLIPADDPDALRPAVLGFLYQARFKKTGEVLYLDAAIQYLEVAIKLKDDIATLLARLYTLGNMYHKRWLKLNQPVDLEKGIKIYQSMLGLTPIGDPIRVKALNALGFITNSKAIISGNITDLDISIHYLKECLELMDLNHPRRPNRLVDLSLLYEMKFKITHESEYLDKCSALQKQILSTETTSDTPPHEDLLESAHSFFMSFERTESTQDLEDTYARLQKALEATTDNSWAQAEVLQSLGDFYHLKSLKFGTPSDLDLCIQRYEESVQIFQDYSVSPKRLIYVIRALSQAYGSRFLSIGAIADLDVGIQWIKQGLEQSKMSTNCRASLETDLGEQYEKRFERSEEWEDLENSILHLQKARDLSPSRKAIKIRILQGLGTIFRHKYNCLGDNEMSQLSINYFSEGLSFVDPRKRGHWDILCSIASTYRSKYDKTRALKDLTTAIRHVHEALDLVPFDYPRRYGFLSPLAELYMIKCQHTNTEEDHEIVIKTLQDAIDCTPEGDQLLGSHLADLGKAYQIWFKTKGRLSDLKKAIEILEQASLHTSSPILGRVYVGIDLSHCYSETGNLFEAHRVAVDTLSLVTLLTPRSLQVSDKQKLLQEVSGIASRAATLALMVGAEPYEAIRHLELGRGIIISSLSDLRLSSIDLERLYPQLAADFVRLGEELDSFQAPTFRINSRHEAGQKLESIIEQVRCLPGFDRFLLMPTEEELKLEAGRGPILIVNISKYGGHAIIITTEKITTLHLPKLLEEDSIYHSHRSTIDRDTLEWLWDTIALPIIDTLGYRVVPMTGSLPRIFWMLTGSLSSLPIHAAGYHYANSVDTVLDRVVSSYCSSLRFLIRSRQNTSRSLASRAVGKAVLTGVQDLPHATDEINELEQLCASLHLPVTIQSPHRQNILESLADCEIFHFAGHGRTNPSDPSSSCLEVKDGPITVHDLFAMKLHHRAPFLAYLSACSTGHNSSENLVDEGLHLIGACQLAGFRHVIGTLRRVQDDVCSDVAKMTYKHISERKMVNESVSEGLHGAIRSLRDQWIVENASYSNIREAENSEKKDNVLRDITSYEDTPMYWAPFVCFSI